MHPDEAPTAAPAAPAEVDLLVVGGGVHGCAAARDAALRGLTVCLVERVDWGWGTSAKSSRLAHGGLRYLEHLEFGLVHEALQERERLLRTAPHLVRPLRFLFPVYPETPSRRRVGMGLMLYDVLAHGRSLPGHEWLAASEARRAVPHLRAEGLRGAASFHDAQVRHVERLVLETMLDARRHGAACLSQTGVARLVVENGAVVGAVLEGPGGRQAVRARAVLNAAGAWADEVLGRLGKPGEPLVRLTKGVHVAVPRFTDDALVLRAADGRTFFVLPWRDTCLLGTTDTDFRGEPGEAAATRGDVEYLLRETRRVLPGAPLDDVLFTYAGVRALVNVRGVAESDVTRRHLLVDHGRRDGVPGLWSLTGGKITTARATAEAVVAHICKALGRRDLARLRPTRTAPLPGTPETPWPAFRAQAVREAVGLGLTRNQSEHLVDGHGRQWRAVLEALPMPDAAQPVVADRPQLACEVAHAVRHEDARTVADVLLRRTDLGLAPPAEAERAAAAVARLMARWLGWGTARVADEMERWRRQAGTLAVPAIPSLVAATETH